MCISTHTTKNPRHRDVIDQQMYNCVGYFCTYPYGLSFNEWHVLLCVANNRHSVTITTHVIKRYFLIWMTTVRQPTKRRCSCVLLTLKCTFICIYWWTRQRIHNTLIVVDRYLRLMGDKTIPDSRGNKTIPDSAEPRLESFNHPFVAGIDLPHQGVVDSYYLHNRIPYTGKMPSLYWIRAQISTSKAWHAGEICIMSLGPYYLGLQIVYEIKCGILLSKPYSTLKKLQTHIKTPHGHARNISPVRRQEITWNSADIFKSHFRYILQQKG